MKKLQQARVIVFGIGGVGGAVAEALVRGGVGHLTFVDGDVVDITNLNRQLIADETTLGLKKAAAAEKRARSINPQADVMALDLFYLPESADQIDLSKFDYIVDAVDNVTAKLELACRAKTLNIPLISAMGTGNKLHPELLEIADISKTSVCPLARVMRRELKKRGIDHLTVVYSKEEPQKPWDGGRTPGSTSFTPPAAGFLIASKVINDLINTERGS